MRWPAIGVVILANSSLALLASGAGPFDGKWVGQGSGAGCSAVSATLAVSDGTVTGGISTGAVFTGGAKIGPDGNVTLVTRGGRSFSVVFSGDKFELHADTNTCGHVDVVGHRTN
jgi:hypothetical protein